MTQRVTHHGPYMISAFGKKDKQENQTSNKQFQILRSSCDVYDFCWRVLWHTDCFCDSMLTLCDFKISARTKARRIRWELSENYFFAFSVYILN